MSDSLALIKRIELCASYLAVATDFSPVNTITGNIFTWCGVVSSFYFLQNFVISMQLFSWGTGFKGIYRSLRELIRRHGWQTLDGLAVQYSVAQPSLYVGHRTWLVTKRICDFLSQTLRVQAGRLPTREQLFPIKFITRVVDWFFAEFYVFVVLADGTTDICTASLLRSTE